MPSLFRRKETDLINDALPRADDADATAAAEAAARARTLSKRERGVATPKRSGQGRRPEPPPANKREAYRRSREKQRQDRADERAGRMAGDDRYTLPRDRGPERALVRDIVDSRRTVGSYFIGGAALVLLGSTKAMPAAVQLVSNVIWVTLALAVAVDSVLISRRVKRLVTARYPKTEERMGWLYWYAVMRGMTFRRMRMPKPRIKLGDPV